MGRVRAERKTKEERGFRSPHEMRLLEERDCFAGVAEVTVDEEGGEGFVGPGFEDVRRKESVKGRRHVWMPRSRIWSALPAGKGKIYSDKDDSGSRGDQGRAHIGVWWSRSSSEEEWRAISSQTVGREMISKVEDE